MVCTGSFSLAGDSGVEAPWAAAGPVGLEGVGGSSDTMLMAEEGTDLTGIGAFEEEVPGTSGRLGCKGGRSGFFCDDEAGGYWGVSFLDDDGAVGKEEGAAFAGGGWILCRGLAGGNLLTVGRSRGINESPNSGGDVMGVSIDMDVQLDPELGGGPLESELTLARPRLCQLFARSNIG
jgi:hypothetical protein